MKKRIFSLLALLLCALFVLGSCGMKLKAPSFDSVFTGENFTAPSGFETQKALSAFDKAFLDATSGNLALFAKHDDENFITYKVYNVETGKVVLTIPDSAAVTNTVSFVSLWDNTALIQVVATDIDAAAESETKLYDAEGTEIVSAKGEEYASENADLVLFNDVYYKAKEGKLTKLLDKAPLANSLPEFDDWNEKYYYDYTYEGVEIYDAKTLKLVKVFSASSKYDDYGDFSCYVLQNGDIFFQGTYRLPDDAEDFDYLEGEEKYAIDTMIFEVKSGKTKTLSFDYFVEGVLAYNSYSCFWILENYLPAMAAFENLFFVYPIVDGYLEESEYLAKTLLIDNDGKIQGSLSEYLPVNSTDIPTQISSDRFLLSDAAGNLYLLNGKGTILGEAGGAQANAKYIVGAGKIFSHDLAEIYDYEKDGYELEQILADSVLLSKKVKNAAGGETTEYSLYKDNGVSVLISGKKNSVYDYNYGYYNYGGPSYISLRYTEAGKTVYVVYSSNGRLLLSSEYAITVKCTTENAAIISTTLKDQTGTLKTVYYRISK